MVSLVARASTTASRGPGRHPSASERCWLEPMVATNRHHQSPRFQVRDVAFAPDADLQFASTWAGNRTPARVNQKDPAARTSGRSADRSLLHVGRAPGHRPAHLDMRKSLVDEGAVASSRATAPPPSCALGITSTPPVAEGHRPAARPGRQHRRLRTSGRSGRYRSEVPRKWSAPLIFWRDGAESRAKRQSGTKRRPSGRQTRNRGPPSRTGRHLKKDAGSCRIGPRLPDGLRVRWCAALTMRRRCRTFTFVRRADAVRAGHPPRR